MGVARTAREWKRSWPAVSQISYRSTRSSKRHFCVRKAAPIVGSLFGWNSFETCAWHIEGEDKR